MPYKIASLRRGEMKEKTLYIFVLAVFEFESLYYVFNSVLACFPPLEVFGLSIVLNRKHLSFSLIGRVPFG